MAQDLARISLESFKLQLHKIASKELERLREQIYEIKRSSLGYLLMYDLERKETAIIAEMMRRDYLNHKRRPKEFEDFNNLTKKYGKKKRLW